VRAALPVYSWLQAPARKAVFNRNPRAHLRFDFFEELRKKEHGAKRSALLRLAILSSGFSKICGLALQAISLPLVYRSLGQHHYNLYLLLTGLLSTIALVQMGAGPGLTQGIAKAHAGGRRDLEASLLRAAFRLTAVAALLGGAMILTVVHAIPPGTLFGPAFSSDRSEILIDTNVCVAFLVIQVLVGVVDSALAGYQEQVFISIGSMVANILCIGLLFLVCRNAPSIIGVILVLYGVPTFFRVINLAVLTLRRPYLSKGFFKSSCGSYAVLMNVGMGFWAIEIAGILEQNNGNYVLAHLSTAQATALFAVVYKSVALASAVVTTVTTPLWPAFADAIAHRDIAWIHRSFQRIRRALTVYSFAVAAVIITTGQWGFSHLMHIDTAGSLWLFVIFGVYFVANVWTHLYYVTLMGLDNLWKIALVILAENLLVLLFGVVMVPRWGASGMALAYLTASVILPAWLLPGMMQRAMRGFSKLPSPAQA
jgi:O-antigen/teichoic acid export membrane protein